MMRVRFLKPRGQYKPGDDAWIERTLARRLCENGKCEPYAAVIKREREAALQAKLKKKREEAATKAAVEKKRKEKAKAEAKAKKKAKKKTAVSRKHKDSEKAVIE